MKTLVTQLKIYDSNKLRNDLIAGLTVAVMLVPQGMAYAMLAGLPPIFGLYAGFIPLLIYPLFGSSHQLSVGPVALVSILVLSGISQWAVPGTEEFISYAILTSLVAGIIQVVLSVLKMGFLINFLSHPVIVGFTSAAAIIIGLSQLKYILGISVEGTNSFIFTMKELVMRVNETHSLSLFIGFGAVALILLIKRYKKALPAALIAVVFFTILVEANEFHLRGVDIVATIPSGLPSFELPWLGWDALIKVIPLALIICLISFIESLAIAKTIAARQERYPINANQELLALGLAKIGGSLFQAFPNTGSFTRSAINDESGAKTGVSSIIAAIVVGLVLMFFTEFFYYLPKAVLASIVIVAVLGLLNISEIKHLFFLDKRDFLVFLITFTLTLVLGVQQGVFAGIILSILIILYNTSRPHFVLLGELPDTHSFKSIERFKQAKEKPGVLVFRFDAPIYFGNAEFFYEKINNAIDVKGNDLHTVILDASSILDIDSTGLQQMELLIQELKNSNIKFAITHCIGPVRDIMQKAGLSEMIGYDNLFLSNADAINAMKTPKSTTNKSNNFASQYNLKTKRK